MRRRNDKRGATLSLVVVTTLVIMVLGMGIFFLTKLLGGARELQNATDSGNLNVAKQSLRTPALNLFGGSGPYDMSGARLSLAQQNFSELRDPQTNQLDLLTYNRAVGQAMLVSMNASSDFSDIPGAPPNPVGISDSKTLIDLLANPNDGLGAVLANKLASDTAMDNSFTNLAVIANLRMLKEGSTAGVVSQVKQISYMVPNSATNLQLNPAVIPQTFLDANKDFVANNIVTQAGGTYLKGYSFINIPTITDNSTYPLMGVPLRPKSNPHLVSEFDFQAKKQSPLSGASSMAAASRIPPNAFRSGGLGFENHQGHFSGMQSCAIAGTVAEQGSFTTSIPCGYIVVANGPGLTPSVTAGQVNTTLPIAAGMRADGYGGGNGDIFGDLLMYNTVWVTSNGAMSQDPQSIADIQKWKQQQALANLPTTPVPANLANAIDGPSPKQSYADGIPASESPTPCKGSNSAPGNPGFVQLCGDNLPAMASVYGSNLPSGGSGPAMTGLMALEREKAGVITPRPSGGPAVISDLPAGTCTGLNYFPTSISNSAPIQFSTPGTIGSLMKSFDQYPGLAAREQRVTDTMTMKIRQIKPDVSQSDLNDIFNQPLPMGQLRYIWFDQTANKMKVTNAASLPSYINPNNILPDGSKYTVTTGSLDVVPSFVNIPGEQGFPNPWDCNGTASYNNTMEWTNSSGFNCVQGVLRFMNCATDAGQPWHCPC